MSRDFLGASVTKGDPPNLLSPMGNFAPRIERLKSGAFGRLLSEKTRAFLGNGYEEPVLRPDDLVGKGSQGSVYKIQATLFLDDGTLEKKRCVAKHLSSSNPRKLPSPSSSDSEPCSSVEDAPVELKAPFSRREPKPHFVHFKATEEDETSVAHNVIKSLLITELYVEINGVIKLEKFAIYPFCDLFLDQLRSELPTIKIKDPDLYNVIVLHAFLNSLDAITHLNYTRKILHRDFKPHNSGFHDNRWCAIDLDSSRVLGSDCDDLNSDSEDEELPSPLFMYPGCFKDDDNPADRSYLANRRSPVRDLYALGMAFKWLTSAPCSFNARWYHTLSKEKVVDYKRLKSQLFMLSEEHRKEFFQYLECLSTTGVLASLFEAICSCPPDQVNKGVFDGIREIVIQVLLPRLPDDTGSRLADFYSEFIEPDAEASPPTVFDEGAEPTALRNTMESFFGKSISDHFIRCRGTSTHRASVASVSTDSSRKSASDLTTVASFFGAVSGDGVQGKHRGSDSTTALSSSAPPSQELPSFLFGTSAEGSRTALSTHSMDGQQSFFERIPGVPCVPSFVEGGDSHTSDEALPSHVMGK